MTVPGTQSSPWNIGAGALTVGNTSTGTLQIGAGGVVSNGSGFVGRQASGTGNVTVNGAAAQWTNSAGLSVGFSGKGTLGIANGGHVTSLTNTYLGVAANSTGTVTVSGIGSQLNSTGFMRVGQTGSGTLQISDQAIVSNSLAQIGYDATGVGVVTVNGAGSQWNSSGELTVGASGNGRLNIANAGAVSSALGTIGSGAGSTGAVTVDGASSSWTNAGLLTVGNLGAGALTISNNATVSAASVRAGVGSGSQGVINIGAAALAVAVAPGTLALTGPSPTVTLGTTGSLVLNHTDNSGGYVFGYGISGAGKVNIYSGTTVLTANNTYTGGTTIAGGTLQLGNGGATGAIVGNVTNHGVLTFNRSDTLPFAGLISGSGKVNQIGAGTTVLTADNTYTGGTTISAGTLQLGNGGATGAIVGDVVNNGALTFNRSDTLAFAGLISGLGSVNQNGTGTTVFTAQHTYSGATHISAGVLRAGTASTFSPNSAVNVATAGTLDLSGYSQSVGAVHNAGLINMGTGTPPGATLTTPTYVGQGGTIAMNTYLGADGSPSDRLVVNGGMVSGASSLIVSNAGGAGAVTLGNGILLVEAVNGATTPMGAFTLGNPGGYVAAGPYAYTLYRSSVDTSGQQSWYLRSTVDCAAAPNNPACKNPEPPPNPPGPPVPPSPPAPPNYRPEVSTAVATPELALRYGSTFLDSLHERIGEERFQHPSADMGGNARVWGRLIGVTGERNGSNAGILGSRGPDFDYKIYGLQSGVDVYRRTNANGSMDHAGIYAAFGRATADVDHLDGRAAGQAAMDGVTLGSYWTHIGKEGWYIDAVIQGTRYDVDNGRSPAGLNLHTRGFGFATSLESGYPVRLNEEWVIEPQAQLVFQNINLNDANDGAAKIRFSDVDSLRGRVGVRLARTVELEPGQGGKRVATTWLRASLVNEFLTNPTTQFSAQNGYVPFRSDMKGMSVQLNVGADVGVKRNLSVYASAGSEISLKGDGQSFNGKVGLKLAF
ncbi:autotransporter outer membrane beta-barrel domain-containing protein [Achromobacter pestifer]|uniref:autotransporter outer membrane beta-barrel domain-containing protein n=1 Tax=Achromobacter pestifer TaxID=1353889 RepID=UPI001581B19A|nr:autotransporter outer membrane beta-barrel domain-containing protein [Achromobacter pestifer]